MLPPFPPRPARLLSIDLDAPTATADAARGGVVAIGNFDGMHPGHRRLTEEVRRIAAPAARPTAILTFEPHPRTVLRPDAPVFRLSPPEAKQRLVGAVGLDMLAVLPFDRAVAALSAEAFVQDVLVDRLAPATVVVGDDFRFGIRRTGNVTLLKTMGAAAGFAVVPIAPVADSHGRYGSGRVRDALIAGDIAAANDLLGYRWFVIGKVIHGDKRGRNLGYPTANFAMPPDFGLRHGIYAVTVSGAGLGTRPAVASYGRRPTFGGGDPLLEIHLFGFSGDLYGRRLTVTFHAWLRPEAHFDSVDTLIRQMDADSLRARAILADATNLTPLDAALEQLAADDTAGGASVAGPQPIA